MEEITSDVTIAVIMDFLSCHEVEYSGRKVPNFDDCDAHWFFLIFIFEIRRQEGMNLITPQRKFHVIESAI